MKISNLSNEIVVRMLNLGKCLFKDGNEPAAATLASILGDVRELIEFSKESQEKAELYDAIELAEQKENGAYLVHGKWYMHTTTTVKANTLAINWYREQKKEEENNE